MPMLAARLLVEWRSSCRRMLQETSSRAEAKRWSRSEYLPVSPSACSRPGFRRRRLFRPLTFHGLLVASALKGADCDSARHGPLGLVWAAVSGFRVSHEDPPRSIDPLSSELPLEADEASD